MIKREELTNPESCMSRAKDDEMTFVLLGRDAAAPVAICAWVSERLRLGKNSHADPQIQEALECAAKMQPVAPLTGPAMEATVRACAEEVWQMYYKPHNLTWNALKERTFEAIAAVVVEAQGALLADNRELRAGKADLIEKNRQFAILTDKFMALIEEACDAGEASEARAEAAEARVRDLEAAAGSARAEGKVEGIRASAVVAAKAYDSAKRPVLKLTPRGKADMEACARQASLIQNDILALLSEPKGASK